MLLFVYPSEKYLLKPKFRKVDIARCRLKNEDDEWKTYYFSCQSGVGFPGRVDVRAKKMGYMFRLKYKAAAFVHVLKAQNDLMTITVDGVKVVDN